MPMRLEDLPDDRCRWCDGEIDRSRPMGITRIYCSAACERAHHHQLGKDQRRERKLKQNRRCAWCDGPVEPQRREDAKYCSDRCGNTARSPVGRRRFPGSCQVCGAAFCGERANQTSCSVACRNIMLRRRLAIHSDRACAHCGSRFHVRSANRSQRFCSRACGHRARSARAAPAVRSCVICAAPFMPSRACDAKLTCSIPCRERLRARTLTAQRQPFQCEAVT